MGINDNFVCFFHSCNVSNDNFFLTLIWWDNNENIRCFLHWYDEDERHFGFSLHLKDRVLWYVWMLLTVIWCVQTNIFVVFCTYVKGLMKCLILTWTEMMDFNPLFVFIALNLWEQITLQVVRCTDMFTD